MQSDRKPGVLYVVATPIGNLEDITLRALRVLREADVIACEDTRHTGQLLRAHNITGRLVSYFEHNEEKRAAELVEKLRGGASVALVTDAGTPGISDPGYRVVKAAREAGISVQAVPGPSAAIAALSISGLPTDRFAFEGFLPARDSARNRRLRELAHESRTMVFFESARRIHQTLSDLATSFGPERRATIARELSKLYEETVGGTLAGLNDIAEQREFKGEITIAVQGAPEADESSEPDSAGLEELLDMGLGVKQASEIIARLRGGNKREIYQRALSIRKKADD